MNIGSVIKKHRLQKELTQEELAEYLNVSVSAVSQWESGKTIPDITMILALANFFAITLDELFDRTAKDKEKALAEYDKQNSEYANRGEVSKQLALWRKAVQEYPGDFHCLCSLAHALHQSVYSGGDTETIENNAKECIAICDRILRDCKEIDTRSSAIQMLVHMYSNKDFPFASEEKAVAYAYMAGDLFTCRDILLEFAYFTDQSKEKRLHRKHINILNYMDLLCRNLYYGKYDSEEEEIQACRAALSLWETLIYDGNYQFFHCRIQTIYQTLAMRYAKLQKGAETIESLKKALYHAKCYDDLPVGERQYTSVFVRAASSDASKHTKNYTNTNENTVQRFMRAKVFDFIRNDADFIALQK